MQDPDPALFCAEGIPPKTASLSRHTVSSHRSPAPAARYAALENGHKLNFYASASGSNTYDISAVVSMIPSGDGITKVQIDFTIPTDNKGNLYGDLPMFKSSTYFVDASGKNIAQIYGETFSYDTKNSVEIQTDLLYSLCLRIQGADVSGFGACAL